MIRCNCRIWGRFKGWRTIVRGMTLRIVECIMEFVYESYTDKKEKILNGFENKVSEN
ncbi:hypothetical protein [Inconstantimicrobium mannanitabidum]|uniref:Uncharacterized protein n=1 Tax=Inconstantimicrobium mannanitabidum TaxID=1604901 RepID=A0ACB5RHM4_9CLOT|nr:hypothetical protein [Clostridium sp. TW13]GKX68608.1 hypothetical protein rsdtw13_38660 [Clostridium sp. TW13]